MMSQDRPKFVDVRRPQPEWHVPQIGNGLLIVMQCSGYSLTMEAKKKASEVGLLVSANVRRIRSDVHGWSSGQLAERLSQKTGDAWTRARVTRAETGERAWRIDDVLLFAAALDVTVDELLRPTGPSGYLRASGATIDLRRVVIHSPAPRPGPTVADLDAVENHLAAARTAVTHARQKIIGGSR